MNDKTIGILLFVLGFSLVAANSTCPIKENEKAQIWDDGECKEFDSVTCTSAESKALYFSMKGTCTTSCTWRADCKTETQCSVGWTLAQESDIQTINTKPKVLSFISNASNKLKEKFTNLTNVSEYNLCIQCKELLGNCEQCSSSAICTKCSTQYGLKNGKCQECKGSLFFDDAHDSCQSCRKTDFSTVESVKDNSCTKCTDSKIATCSKATCADGYHTYKTGKCEMCSSNCEKCSASDKCTECALGYYSKDGECQKCSSSCEKCSTEKVCIKCAEKYMNDDGVCTALEEQAADVEMPFEAIGLTCAADSKEYVEELFCEAYKTEIKADTCRAKVLKCEDSGSSGRRLSTNSFKFNVAVKVKASKEKIAKFKESTSTAAASTSFSKKIQNNIEEKAKLDGETLTNLKTENPTKVHLGQAETHSCKTGSYLDDVSTKCEKCKRNCATCKNVNTCYSCDTDYALLNNVCVPADGWADSSFAPSHIISFFSILAFFIFFN